MKSNMTRRAVLASTPLVIVGAPTVSRVAPDLPSLVENVMSSIVPYRSGFVAVKAEHLRALCEATGVEWGEHGAMRGKT